MLNEHVIENISDEKREVLKIVDELIAEGWRLSDIVDALKNVGAFSE